jgi:hypothetical protein
MIATDHPYETHGIGYGGGSYPSARVKVDVYRTNADALADVGIDDPEAFRDWLEELPERDRTALDETAWLAAAETWWHDTLPMLVEEWNASHPDQTFPMARIQQEGRSGGWVVLREDHDGARGESWGWDDERRQAWAELAARITERATTEGPYSYWWQLGQLATDLEGYGQEPPADPHAVVGELRVTDEHGFEHVVTIRREDLTTTNAGYRAIRDEITETLARVLAANREP